MDNTNTLAEVVAKYVSKYFENTLINSGLLFMNKNSCIVYQCYGNEGIFYECVISMLSLSRLYPDGQINDMPIWIYTDKPEWFSRFKNCPLQMHFRTLDAATLHTWRGKIDFVHRVKIELLKDLTKTFTGNILYVDTDVVFLKDINEILKQIEGGRFYMHVMEGIIKDEGNPVLAKLNKHLVRNNFKQANGQPMNELAMWNAGVLGFSTRFANILDDVLLFTDKEYPAFSKHIVEQFAFSVRFQQEEAIKGAAPYMIHYWNLKEVRPLLASFFNHFKDTSWETLVAYSAIIQVHVLMQEKANFYSNRSIYGKLTKAKWMPVIPDWERVLTAL